MAFDDGRLSITLPSLELTSLGNPSPTPLPPVATGPFTSSLDISLPSSAQLITGLPPSPSSASAAISSSSPSSSSSLASTTSSLSSSISTPTPSPVAANDPQATSPKHSPNVGLILGLLFGILALLALALFFVRRTYIRRRHQHQESGQRLAYTKAKYTISSPTNFTVVESRTLGIDGQPMAAGFSRPGTSMSIREDWGNDERPKSPERMRERNMFDGMSGLESGLKDQMRTMISAQLGARKPVPAITVEVDRR